MTTEDYRIKRKRESKSRWVRKNRERHLVKRREWREKNKERLNAIERERYRQGKRKKEDPVKKKERMRRWYEKRKLLKQAV